MERSKYIKLTDYNTALDISKELYYIERPYNVRTDEMSSMMFSVEPLNDGSAVMIANPDHNIYIHPSNDLSTLYTLINATEEEKQGLKSLIESGSEINFKDITPSSAVYLSEEDVINLL